MPLATAQPLQDGGRATAPRRRLQPWNPLSTMRRALQWLEKRRPKTALEYINLELMKTNAALKQEIAERQKAESLTLLHLRRAQAIVTHLPLGAFVADEDNQIVHLNQRCCDLWGVPIPPESFVGRPRTAFLEQAMQRSVDPAGYMRGIHLLSGLREPVLGTEVRLRDGRILSRDVIPLFAAGRPQGQLLLFRDVTKEKRLDASKSEFMSLASHQLRTPLTAIRWSLGRLDRSLAERASAAERKLLHEGRSGAVRMAHTIDTMLAISRIEAGKVRLEPSDLRLGVLLNDMRVECRGLYEEKRQSFTLDCPPNVQLRTDQHILSEILCNLYTNAIKYTPDGGSIAVRGIFEGSRVRIEVRDTGCGIPPHQAGKVFTKFFRGDNVIDQDTEGNGLGLYLVSLLVQMLQGDISFQSEEGKGTVFTVVVPSILPQNPGLSVNISLPARAALPV